MTEVTQFASDILPIKSSPQKLYVSVAWFCFQSETNAVGILHHFVFCGNLPVNRKKWMVHIHNSLHKKNVDAILRRIISGGLLFAVFSQDVYAQMFQERTKERRNGIAAATCVLSSSLFDIRNSPCSFKTQGTANNNKKGIEPWDFSHPYK